MPSCKAPWNHIWVENTGKIKPCCVFNGEPYNHYIDPQHAFDSIENREIRKRMMEGVLPECEGCEMHKDFQHFGIEDPAIRTLEISFDNNCNFKCVHCNSKFSYLWYSEDDELSLMDFNRTALYKFENEVEVDVSKLESVKFAGGEPFLSRRCLEMVRSLPKECTVMFNTNNSIFPVEWIDALLRLQRVVIIFSIDGVNEVGEFVRYGYKQKRQDRNIRKWLQVRSRHPNIQVHVNYCSHAYNALDFHNTENHLASVGLTPDVCKISIDNVKEPDYLDLRYFPDETKSMVAEYIHEERILDWMHSGEFDKSLMMKFLNFTTYLEQRQQLPKDCETIYEQVLSRTI